MTKVKSILPYFFVKICTFKKELKKTEPVFNIQYKISLEGKIFSRANLHFTFSCSSEKWVHIHESLNDSHIHENVSYLTFFASEKFISV
ncbi:hypothetical protein MSLAZ_2650 [Methanosarcina lacustris Z-7289]|uniref:Uncharacterized protein n=1 Tax=Methanosarcina lacustris Z-7289 TaxID=1434111 RepID=A0A0E3S636_9EURY|nr:hypothetical protein MSLAZ_2650 [Methanosarcina lacustris Z-7289]